MADDNSKSWTLLKGIGGIAGAVITAVLIYYFTRPPVPPPAAISFEGLVSNVASHDPVPDANVTVSIGTNSVQQKTDAEGRYAVVLNGTANPADMGTVAIQATGYEPYSNSVAFTSGENFAEIPIEAIPPHTAGQPAAPTFHVGKPVIFKIPPATYKKKQDIAYQANFKK